MENNTINGSIDEIAGNNKKWAQVLLVFLAFAAFAVFLLFFLRSQLQIFIDSPDYLTQKDSERFTIGLNFAQACSLIPEKSKVSAFVLEQDDQNSKSGYCEILLEDTSGNSIRLSFKNRSLVRKDFKWLMNSHANRLNLLRLQSMNELEQTLTGQKKKLFPPQKSRPDDSRKKI